MRRRPVFALLAALLVLAGCASPPADKYVAGSSVGGVPAVDLGRDTAGEACTGQPAAGGETLVYCGGWEQPSGRVTPGGPAAPGAAPALARDSPWRAGIDARLVCDEPLRTEILGDLPAVTMQCARKLGGWPEVAIVAVSNGHAWFAAGVQPSFPVLQRALGVASGRIPAAQAPLASAQGLQAARLAAASYSAHDIGTYEGLLRQAARANLENDYVDAEKAYRRAAEVLDKQHPGNPDAAVPIMAAALQLSDEGRVEEADAMFARAEVLVHAPQLTDRAAVPRLLHYRGIALLNQGKPAQALPLFRQAEAGYAALLPPDALRRNGLPGQRAGGFGAIEQRLAAVAVLRDTEHDEALLGLIEVRRYEAIALKEQGRGAEAQAILDSADALSRSSGLRAGAMDARLLRTSGAIAFLSGRRDAAFDDFAGSVMDFERSLPDSRPVAITDLLRAASLQQAGRLAEALASCREASAILRARGGGIAAAQIGPCIDVFGDAATRDAAHAQALLADAFEAAQLTQGGLTSQQIAEAAAELQENARNPKVAAVFRQQRDARDRLDELQRQRDALAAAAAGTADPRLAALDAKIEAARKDLEDAVEAVQASDPNLPQLVQQAVPAHDVLASLAPGELFAAFVLDDDRGWVFALRDGRIALARIDHGAAAVDPLVARLRSSFVPGPDYRPPPFDAKAAQQLYAVLFDGVAAELLDTRRLIVAPSGALLSIPFSILLTGPADPDNPGQAPFLVRRMSIAHVPSAANFVNLRRAAGGSRAPLPWFGFGDFQPVTPAQAQRSFSPASCGDSAALLATLPPLPGALKELSTARQLLAASPDAQLLGPAFTADAVLRAPLQNYRVLHFATHALLPTDLRCQDQPAIVTSPPAGAADASGALLTAGNVQAMHLDADAVILSACNTGGPGGKAGESLSGLARGFFHAGARAMMVTHWEASDAFAAYIVALTIGSYAAGEDFPDALAGAERTVLDEARGASAYSAHPYYWAPFAIIGAGRGKVAA